MVQYVQLGASSKNASKLKTNIGISAIIKIILAVICLIGNGLIMHKTAIYPQVGASILVIILAIRSLLIVNSKKGFRVLVRYNISVVVVSLFKCFLIVQGGYQVAMYYAVSDTFFIGTTIVVTILRLIILILTIVVAVYINKLKPKNISRKTTNITQQQNTANSQPNHTISENLIRAPVMVQQPQPDAMVQQPGGTILVQQPNGMAMVQQPQPVMMVQQPNRMVMVQQPQSGMMVQQPNHMVMVQQPQPGMMVQQPSGMVMMEQPQAVVQQNNNQTESTATEPPSNQTNQLKKTETPLSYS